MTTASDLSDSYAITPRSRTVAGIVLWCLWQAIRIPAYLFLSLLAPVVRVALSGVALLGLLTTLLWECVHPQHFPFAMMLGMSLGFGLLLYMYEWLLGLLSR
ncbi:MAG TPA: hypothetical protein VK700_09865 [Steroidobacteraceae bacterium]|jgi:hypothetical protein|nr:hypothetical protein [Steroidobacteraceae bacterium]